ncbi:MAG TPA: hypothetical protein PKH07_20900, partial [bacterium]|nr:hypothetical protein [bacterium]
MKRAVFILILPLTLFSVRVFAVPNEIESFDGTGAYSGFDLPSWSTVGASGSFSVPAGQYKISSSGAPVDVGLERFVGQGDFESTLYVSNFTGWDTSMWQDGLRWQFWDSYMQDGISVVLDSARYYPNKALWVDKYVSGVKTTTTQLNLGSTITSLKWRVLWTETDKKWEVFYRINGGPAEPADVPAPDMPLTGYVLPSQSNRLTKILAYENISSTGVTAWLDNYIMAPRFGETPTPTNTVTPTFTVNFDTPTPTPVGLSAPEVYVSQSYGNDVTGDGTIDNPWASIVYALSQVNADSNRHVNIRVSQGVYIGQVQMKSWTNL